MRTFRTTRIIATPACLAALFAGAAAGQQHLPTLPHDELGIGYVGPVPQDFFVPGYVGSEYRFVIEGADGGWVEEREQGSRVDFRAGGNGASIRFSVRIGFGEGELRPGGTVRYIIGEEGGSDFHLTNGRWNTGPGRAGGDGGGGSAILYLPPEETDWYNAVILAAAGGGGGAFMIGGPTTSVDGVGANGRTGPCSSGPTLGCDDAAFVNCEGYAGGFIALRDNIPNNAQANPGGGAYARDGEWVLGHHGFPFGSDRGADGDYGWGFGAGGFGSFKGPGGGGGYSGGATYSAIDFDLPRNFECKGGGGGGGSYINAAYFIPLSDERFQTNERYDGYGTSNSVVLTLENNEPQGAVSFQNGTRTLATLDRATPTATGMCGESGGADLWYSYTNTSSCAENATIVLEPLSDFGSTLPADSVWVNAFVGESSIPTECAGVGSSGTFTAVVMPGETVQFAVYKAPFVSESEVSTWVSFDVQAVPDFNSVLEPVAIETDVEQTVTFCGVPFTALDFTGCDPLLTEGHVAYYEVVNDQACAFDVTFRVTDGLLTGVRVFDIENLCREAFLGEMTRTLAPGERMLLQVTSQTGEPISFSVDRAYLPGEPDCDGDGIPDGCDADGSCQPLANDMMADAEPLLLGEPAPYSLKFATRDGSSGCESSGDDVDIWYSYTATVDGQLIVNAVSDAGDGMQGLLGLAAFSSDGQMQLDCDLGEDAGRSGLDPSHAVGLVSMRAGETVLLRVSVPSSIAQSEARTGLLSVAGFDPRLPNDICGNSTEIDLAGPGVKDTVYLTMDFAQNEGSTGFCFDNGGADQYDVWFSYTAPVSGEATFESQVGGGALAGGLELYDGCGGELLACNGGAAPVVSHPVTAGETVKLRLLRSADTFGVSLPYVRLTLTESGCGPADTNNDGQVTPADFNAWVLAFNSQAPECDQNGDGFCTPADFNAWVLNFNSGC
ncbi:MAG: GC-type dockerin domain-anchored protein [Planctomycetota bacterium]